MSTFQILAQSCQWFVIEPSGTTRRFNGRATIGEIHYQLCCEILDTVNLRGPDGRPTGLVMLVDDGGHQAQRAVNAAATALYHAQCKPGTTFEIRGPVAICRDADFAER